MTQIEVKEYIINSSPFESDELPDNILNNIIKQSLKVLNRYSPKIIRGDFQVLSDPEMVKRNVRAIRVYYDLYDTSFSESMSAIDLHKTGSNAGMYSFYAIDWRLEDIQESGDELVTNMNRNYYYYWTELILAHTYMFCANKRRSATLSELPFNINGNEFFNEGKDRLEKTIIEMSNAIDNMI